MSVLDALLSSAQGGAVQTAAKQFGFDAASTEALLKNLVPALSKGVKKNIATSGGIEALTSTLGQGNHQRYLDDPAALGEEATVAEGNGILGHLLGSKDASREVAKRAASSTGLDEGLIKKFLPLIAAAGMGALSKQTGRGANLAEGGAGGALSILGGLLDSDGDGQVIDDLLSLGKKFI